MTGRRFLLITPDYPPPNVGGSLVYFYTLVEHAEDAFDILTAPLRKGYAELPGDRHRVIRSRFLVPSTNPTGTQLLWMYLYLTWVALRIGITRRYDVVVFFTSAIGNGFFSVLFKLLRVKIVLIAFAEEITLAQHAPKVKGVLKRFFMRGYPFADGFVCICDFVKDLIIDIGAHERQMCVIPTPICPSKATNPAPAAQRGGARRNVLTAGRLVRRKGFHLVIDALDRLRRDIPNVHLTIAGDGDEMPHLVRQAREKSLEQHITFAGLVTDDAKMAELYAECELFVLANLFLPDGNCEGSPNVLIEASAQSKPVIGGREGGTATAVRDGVTGFLVDPTDVQTLAERMKEILTNPDLARRLGEAGRRRVEEEHDPISAGKRFSDFIRSVAHP